MKNNWTIYFLQRTNTDIKIGHTKYPIKYRVTQLQKELKEPLIVLNSIEETKYFTEHKLHKHFQQYRICLRCEQTQCNHDIRNKSEWFISNNELIETTINPHKLKTIMEVEGLLRAPPWNRTMINTKVFSPRLGLP